MPRIAEIAMKLVGSLLLAALAACASGPPDPKVMEMRAPGWVGDSAAGWDAVTEPLVLRATGRSPRAADAQARASKAATASLREALVEGVARLDAAYAERNADLFTPEALTALTADKAADQRVIEAAMTGARLKGEWADDEAFFVWMELDAGAHLLPAFESELGTRLAAHARELTAADRTALRDALAEVVAGRQQR
jgi:hypothetical protein